ncbi:MAG: hypothetical protein LUM44_20190 [Pyrinomonadaceae bacterium]|nr:hypothetical protein [Pyrinomonadaceae bacterium]
MSLFTKLVLIFTALVILAMLANFLLIKFFYWGDKKEAPKKLKDDKED